MSSNSCIVYVLVLFLKDLRRGGLSYFGIFEEEEKQESPQVKRQQSLWQQKLQRKQLSSRGNRYPVLCMSHVSSASLLHLLHLRPSHVLLLPSAYLSLMHCSLMSLVQCMVCPATEVSSCILSLLQAAEKAAEEQRKKDKEATRLAAAAEEEKAREPKEAAQKEAEQQRKQVLCPLQAVLLVFSFSLKHCSLSASLGPFCSHPVKKDSIVSPMPCLSCLATAVPSCILSPLQAERRKKDKEATRLAAAAEEEKAREANEAAQKEAEQQRRQVLCPWQAVSFVISFSLNHCSLSRSLVPVCSHLVPNDSIVSLLPCLGCPATPVPSCILCPLQAEKEADEQGKKDEEATRLAAAAEEEEARDAKETAEKATAPVFFPL